MSKAIHMRPDFGDTVTYVTAGFAVLAGSVGPQVHLQAGATPDMFMWTLNEWAVIGGLFAAVTTGVLQLVRIVREVIAAHKEAKNGRHLQRWLRRRKDEGSD
jgi:hypothetical protein